MSNLKFYNKKTLNVINKLKLSTSYDEHLSAPLLVSSKCMENSEEKIMYIGQETNRWVNNKRSDSEIDVDILEEEYYNFLDRNPYQSFFWKFINNIINEKKVIDSVIWTNAIIAGRREGKGNPKFNEKLMEVSVDYLINLYNESNPSKVIIVCGPNNPYYNNIIKFLEAINIEIEGYPTKNNPLIMDDSKKIIWTYHPNYLWRSKKYNDVVNEIKVKIKK